MSQLPTILADTDTTGKLIFAVIVAIFWGIGALSSVIKKAKEASKRQAAIRTSKPATAYPAIPSLNRPVPQMARKMPAPARRPQQTHTIAPFIPRAQVALPPNLAQRAAALQQMVHTAQAPHAVPPPMPAPVIRAKAAAPVAQVAAASQVTRPGVRAAGANASSIRRWLQPDSLRKQFILTELLQPAMALREPQE